MECIDDPLQTVNKVMMLIEVFVVFIAVLVNATWLYVVMKTSLINYVTKVFLIHQSTGAFIFLPMRLLVLFDYYQKDVTDYLSVNASFRFLHDLSMQSHIINQCVCSVFTSILIYCELSFPYMVFFSIFFIIIPWILAPLMYFGIVVTITFSVLQIGYIVSLFLTIIILFKVIKTYRRRYLIVDVADLNRKTKSSVNIRSLNILLEFSITSIIRTVIGTGMIYLSINWQVNCYFFESTLIGQIHDTLLEFSECLQMVLTIYFKTFLFNTLRGTPESSLNVPNALGIKMHTDRDNSNHFKKLNTQWDSGFDQKSQNGTIQ